MDAESARAIQVSFSEVSRCIKGTVGMVNMGTEAELHITVLL